MNKDNLIHSPYLAEPAERHNAPEGVPLEQTRLPRPSLTGELGEANLERACALTARQEAGQTLSEVDQSFLDDFALRLDKFVVDNLGWIDPVRAELIERRGKLNESGEN